MSKRRFDHFTLSDGTKVRIRSLTRSEQRQCQKDAPAVDGKGNPFFDDVFLSYAIVDDDGNRLVSTQQALDGHFNDWDVFDSEPLIAAAYALSYSRGANLEAALKNFSGTTTTSSSGDSSPTAPVAVVHS